MSFPGLDGHGGHAADIVPPVADFAGLNWTPENEAILTNGCKVPTMTPTPTDSSSSATPTETSSSTTPTETSSSATPSETSPSPTPSPVETITICHATGSESNPFEAVTVALPGLDGHGVHAGDIIPPMTYPPTPGQNWGEGSATWENGCVTPTMSPSPTETSPSPTETSASPTGTSPTPTDTQSRTVTICHATSSSSNPYNVNTVSVYGLDGHGDHPNDIIPPIEDPAYPGQNWTPENEAILTNGCQTPTMSPTPTVTVTQTVTATATSTATHTATATVTETATQTATATQTVPGPTSTVVIPGPTSTIVIPIPGPTQTVTVTATVLPPTTSAPPTSPTATETTVAPPTSPTATETTVAPPTSPTGSSTTILPPPNTPTTTTTVYAPMSGGNYPTGVNAGGGGMAPLPGKPDWVWALAALAASIGILAAIRAVTIPAQSQD
ncbi:MAG: hypothetical protein ACR2KE_08350 [Candidatus Nanopelagicales bacterium]